MGDNHTPAANWLEDNIDSHRIEDLRHKLQENTYMHNAVQRIAKELTIEIMENTYGVPFR